jgi:hypothetical protein
VSSFRGFFSSPGSWYSEKILLIENQFTFCPGKNDGYSPPNDISLFIRGNKGLRGKEIRRFLVSKKEVSEIVLTAVLKFRLSFGRCPC